MSKEEFKQDCETKASRRLSEKIKKRYPRQADLLNGIDHEGHSVNILRYEHFSLKKKGVERTIKKYLLYWQQALAGNCQKQKI